MTQYVALIHKDPSSDFGVSFPDFPGCVTAGSTIEEARVMAEEALAFHIEGMLDDGETVPAPSSLDEIMKVRENMNAVAFLVDAQIAERAIRINVSIPERELKAIDAYAQTRGLSRSGLFLKAAKLVIAEDRL
ncbi:type II toxin-antitoxin system HicB family antitoxin [Rhizobium sp.]